MTSQKQKNSTSIISRAKSIVSGTESRKKVMKGVSLTIVGFGGQKVLQLISNLILTRLLFPEDFGLMALVTVFITGLQMFSDVGVRTSIVRSPRGEETDFLQTAWTIQVLRGFILCIMAMLLAWPAAQFYGEDILTQLLCFAALAPLFRGFENVGVSTANRNMMVGRLYAVQLISQVISLVVSITLALTLQSVWVLVIGMVSNILMQVVLGHIFLGKIKHRFCWEKEAVQEIIHFGKWIFFATFLTFLGGRGINLIQGAYVSIKTLGLMAVAETISWAASELSEKIMQMIILPNLAKVARENPADFPRRFRKVRLYVFCAILPLFFSIAILSQFIIDLLYDPRYSEAGMFLMIMCFSRAFHFMSRLYNNACLARGESKIHMMLEGAGSVLRIAGLVTGYYLAGVHGMLAGVGVGSLVLYIGATLALYKRGWVSIKSELVLFMVIGLLITAMYQLVYVPFVPS